MSYIKFLPNEYVLHYRNGKLIGSGAGLSFYYFNKSTAAALVPTSGMDADFIFQVKTADFQTVTVLKLHRVHAVCDVNNEGIIRVFEKTGLRNEGRMVKRGKNRPEEPETYFDQFGYAILAEEWTFKYIKGNEN